MLEQLKLTNFRSYPKAEFDLAPKITLVVGPNASGKTNLLEAIYVLTVTRSFRAKDRDLINHGQDFFVIGASAGDVSYRLGFDARGGPATKTLKRAGAKLPLSRHLGTLPVVLFEPGDLDLIGGRPERRRAYLDFILCQTDPEYLSTLRRYRHVLKQRNRLLEGFQIEAIKDQIMVWDLKLTELAAQVYETRLQLLIHLNSLVSGHYQAIADDQVDLQLSYLPSVDGDYADRFMEALNRNLTRDLAAGFTTIGPHREDFGITFNGGTMSARASRGEVRTVVLALKLGELAYQESQLGIKPLLLLDDVFSELDRGRRQFLVKTLGDNQTVITATDADAVKDDLPRDHQLILTSHG